MKKILVTAIMSALIPSGALMASTVLLDEHFLDNSLANGTNSGETDTAWYFYNNNAGGVAYSTNTDSTGLMSGNVMRNAASGATNTLAIGTFSTVTLGTTGDWIKLAFDYRITTADSGKRMFFGLFNNNGTATTSNEFGILGTTSSADDLGYNVQKYLNNATLSTLYQKAKTTENNKSLNDAITSIASLTSTASLADANVHHVELLITRVATGLEISVNIDNAGASSFIDTAPLTNTFNEVGLSANPSSNGFLWDNIVVTADIAPIPEPAAMGIIGTGAGMCILTLRNKK